MTDMVSASQLEQITSFNFCPLEYIDASWLEDMKGGKMIVRLKTSSRCETLLNRFLIRHFKLENQYEFDLTQGIRSVALLDMDAITQLARTLGMVANRKVLRAVIRKQDREVLKEHAGEVYYDLVMKHASHLKLEQFTAFDFRIDWDDMAGFQNQMLRTGLHCIGAALSSESRSLRTRMQLKLPAGWKAELDIGAEEFAGASGQARDVMLQIHQEVNREWLESLS
ncbi:SctK family type III secretion system sorting platform protein [Endozoicomonadaceae bacterium StTr2]